jgi:hypothetical protein
VSRLTDDPNDPALTHGVDDAPVPQAEAYLVLSDEERAKGFVRPVRRSYVHVGPAGPKHPLRDLTPEELALHDPNAAYGFVKFEDYPPQAASTSVVGRFWTRAQLDAVGKGCRAVTTMSLPIAETYARDPSFYGATYCVRCGKHLPVGEFRWLDGQVVGS